MKSQRWRWLPVVLAVVAAVTGCGQHPTAPAKPEPGVYSNPAFARVPATRPGLLNATADGPLEASAEIDGELGGVISVGRFSVVVPPGSFQGVGTIAITVPDQAVVACELGISTPGATGFAQPVSLVANCQGVTNVNLEDCGTLRFDSAANVWRNVDGATISVESATVVTPLSHQATIYGVADLFQGRAGW